MQDKYIKVATKYVIENRNSVIGWDILSDESREHIYNIAASVMLTRDCVVDGGGFVRAIIDNNLEAAISKADADCIKALKVFVLVKLWCRI